MSQNIQIKTRFSDRFIPSISLSENKESAIAAYKKLISRSGEGNEFLGWIDLPDQITNENLSRLENTAKRIQEISDYLVVVGIGGSYLGARAVIEAIQNPFSAFDKSNSSKTQILYAGHHLDPDYHNELINFLKDKDFSVNVISKSGTTTEPAVAFRLLIDLLEEKYGKEGTKSRVVATTDASKGALKKFADDYGFETFVIPDDVGGRFSVLTPVGLLPIAVAGANIRDLVKGAQEMRTDLLDENNTTTNLAIKYAYLRNAIYQTGRKVEILVNYNPAFHYFSEWWKQLYGESEGKSQKGIFPASVDLTTDLHSMGQYIQDGERMLFETVVSFGAPKKDIELVERDGDVDGLNYLKGKQLSWVGEQATLGTLVAHTDGGVPCIELNIPKLNEFYIGQLIYFFEFACGVSGYMLGVNPFDQPGVEDYKNNMFALLGKKGYEAQKKAIEKKLGVKE
ncbi:MAG: glucose-6-phosphate isomerase [Leptospira sp.]|nr:glucose-6-phosphate isomerase [Leptospira sp.]